MRVDLYKDGEPTTHICTICGKPNTYLGYSKGWASRCEHLQVYHDNSICFDPVEDGSNG